MELAYPNPPRLVILSVAKDQVAVGLSTSAGAYSQADVGTPRWVVQSLFFPTHLILRYAQDDRGELAPVMGNLLAR